MFVIKLSLIDLLLDYARLEEQVIETLIETAKLPGSFITEYLQKLRIRISDGARTEIAYHGLIQQRLATATGTLVDIPRLTCSLHAQNTALRS